MFLLCGILICKKPQSDNENIISGMDVYRRNHAGHAKSYY